MRLSRSLAVPLVLLLASLLTWLPSNPEASHLYYQSADEADRLGAGELEERQGLRIIHLSGTPYEAGYQHGTLLREEIRDRIRRVVLERVVLDGHVSHLLLLRHAREVESYLPHEVQEEMLGLAHGAGVSYSQILLLNTYGDLVSQSWAAPTVQQLLLARSPRFLPRYSAPPSVTVAGSPAEEHVPGDTGEVVVRATFAAFGGATADAGLLHVAEFRPPLASVGDLLFVVHRPTVGNAFVAVGRPGAVGVEVGLNEEGLSVTAVSSPSQDSSMAGVPLPFVVREVLQHAGDIRTAERFLANADRTTGHNVLIGDGKRPDAHAVEFSTHSFAVFEAENGLLVRTGHFLDEDLAETQLSLPGWDGVASWEHLDAIHRALRPLYGQLGPPEVAALLAHGEDAGDATGGRGSEGAVLGILLSPGELDIRPVTRDDEVAVRPGISLDEER